MEAIVISVKREIAGAAALFCVVSCSGPTDPRGSIDVNVLADLVDQRVPVTVQNNSAEMIMWSSTCGGGREKLVGLKLWIQSIPEWCHLVDWVVTIDTIQPGEEHTREDAGSVENWEAGQYRFKPNLLDKSGEMLPDKVRTSNSFRIKD
jgi:hypothetical protein